MDSWTGKRGGDDCRVTIFGGWRGEPPKEGRGDQSESVELRDKDDVVGFHPKDDVQRVLC